MKTKTWFTFLAAAILFSFAGCAPKPVEFDLSVAVSFEGHPLRDAEVLVDGASVGTTNSRGMFAKPIAKLPDHPIKVEVRAEEGKLRLTGWDTTFTIKKRKDSEPKESKSFSVALQRYVNVAVKHDGAPVAGAEVSVAGQPAGETAQDGTLQVSVANWPKTGLNLSAQKEGLGQTDVTFKGESGDNVDIVLYKEAVVQIEALEERNGIVKPVQGATVSVSGREVGKTGPNGIYTYHQKGKLGGSASVRISAAGYAPSTYTHEVKMAGSEKLRQYFYSAAAVQPRAAVMGFVANTRGEDISDVVKVVEPAFTEKLFGEKGFKQVPAATAKNLIKRSKLSYNKLKSTGWRGTPLAEQVDVLIFGSVARGQGDTYVVEASFYDADGKQVMTQAAVLESTGSWRVGRTMGEIVDNVLANYPFVGVVTGSQEGATQVNLGKGQYPLDSDDVYLLKVAKRDAEGRITGYSDGGAYKVRRLGDAQSELVARASAAPARAGDRMVRLNAAVAGVAEGADKVVFAVTGGKEGEGAPLAGANLYIDERWVGTTDRKGEATVPLRLDHKYDLIVYHHGYEQAAKTIKPAKKGERFQFALKSFTTDFTIESDPSNATVSLDDQRIGTTPMTKAYQVTPGFHTVRVDAGGGYRAWEEVVEFEGAEKNMTGDRMVTMYKDYLRQGDAAEEAGKYDEAIRLYSAAPKEHPDYADIHSHLGQLYLDDKHDVDHAIAEFELVSNVPEVRELVYKQYAIVYTNLGKAYYMKGHQMLKTDRNKAVEYFAKAIKALDRARENTRFFPDERHDEAVHDTYYYRAMSYHNLYQITGREALRTNVENAWNEYLDFFPEKLRGNPEFEQLRESGMSMAQQIEGK